MSGNEFPASEFTRNSLGFRAACNEGAPPVWRPVNVRVLSRISEDGQAKAIVDRVWRNVCFASSELNPPFAGIQSRETDHLIDERDRLFFVWKALSEDLAWKALVLEKIIEEHKWRDSWKTITQKPLEGIQSLIEKFWSKENPTTRSAGITLTAFLTLVAGHSAIRLAADPDLAKDLHWLGSIPLALNMPTATQLPHFSIDTAGLASQLPAIPISSNAPTLKVASSTANLEDPNGLLTGICCRRDENALIAKELHNISNKLASEPVGELAVVQEGKIGQSGIDGPIGPTSLQIPSADTLLDEMRNQTHEFQRQSNEMKNQLEQMRKQVEVLQGQLAEAKNQTHEFQTQNESLWNGLRVGTFSSHLTFSRRDDVQSLSFPVSTPGGSVKLVPLTVEVVNATSGGAGAHAKVIVVSTDDGKTLFDEQIDQGAAKTIGRLNAALMLNSVERRWLVHPIVRVSIVQN